MTKLEQFVDSLIDKLKDDYLEPTYSASEGARAIIKKELKILIDDIDCTHYGVSAYMDLP